MAVVIVVLLLAIAAGGVVGVALLGSHTDTGGSLAGTGAAASTPTPETSSDSRAAMVTAVRDYYGVVTDDSASGWARLGPGLQSQTGGLTTYQGFWSTISSVQVLDATAENDDTVLTRLVFSPIGRSTSQETHRLGMLRGSDGGWLINSDDRVG